MARASDESITNAEELREFLKAYGLNDIQANRVVQLRFPGEQQGQPDGRRDQKAPGNIGW